MSDGDRQQQPRAMGTRRQEIYFRNPRNRPRISGCEFFRGGGASAAERFAKRRNSRRRSRRRYDDLAKHSQPLGVRFRGLWNPSVDAKFAGRTYRVNPTASATRRQTAMVSSNCWNVSDW